MRNSPVLPWIAVVVAALLALAVWASHGDGPLTELELGGIAWSIGLGIYGLQGIISVLIEGQELRPGRVLPRLTNPLSVAIVLFAMALFVMALLLAYGLIDDWGAGALGALAGGGCLVLSLLLVLYKEAFVGDEACFDERDDGVPW